MGYLHRFVCALALLAATTAATPSKTSTKSSSTKSTTSRHVSTTPTAKAHTYDMTVQTIFTPPPACASQRISSMDISSGELWNNAIIPATGVIESSCYPSQFWSSAVATTSLPPFKQIVCPKGWGTNQINSTYVVCCPGGYGLYAPSITNTQRPATGAICTSWIWPNALYDITSWNSASIVTTIAATEGPDGTLVFATPFDGIAASTTITSAPSSSKSSSSKSSMKTSSSTTPRKTSSGVALSTLPP